MGIIGKDFKYKKVENFLDENELKLLRNYCEMFHRFNTSDFDHIQNNLMDTGVFSDYVMESLMAAKKEKMESLTGLKLFPTYTYWRMYTTGAVLTPHTDREACEISVTVNLGTSEKEPWPIFIDEKPINLKPGDAAIYLGCEVPHWREEFEGNWNAQVFLHYVNQEGPNKHHKFDRRLRLGMKKVS